MLHLTISRIPARFLSLRKVSLLLSALLLTAIALWLLFHALSPADAQPAPTSLEQPMTAEAHLASLASAAAPAFNTRRFFGPPTGHTYSLAVGDMNGDGVLDIVTGDNMGQNAVYLNDGIGNFAVYTGTVDCTAPPANVRCFGTGMDETGSVAVGDMNDDGMLDIVVGNHYEQNAVYLNDGTGSFPNTSAYTRAFGTASGRIESVAVGDMNGDAALDIVVGDWGGQNAVYLNDGDGHFFNTSAYTRPFGTGTDSTRSVALGDMNGDGKLDIVVDDFTHQSIVYLNDGAGNFYAGPVNCAAPNVRCFGTGSDSTTGVAVGDLNDDGALDILAGGAGKNVIYLNDGSGNFYSGALDCAAPPANVRCFGYAPDSTHLAVGDMNGDGALDIVIDTLGVVYLNDGAGSFYTDTVDCAAPPANAVCFGADSRYVAVADMNGDGALDIVAGRYGPSRVYLNNGASEWTEVHSLGTAADATTSVAVGDMNGDDALDIVVGIHGPFDWSCMCYPGQNVIYLNDGSGSFPNTSVYTRAFGSVWATTTRVAIGDMNGDGALDIVASNEYSPATTIVYLNDGAGNFYTGTVNCLTPPANAQCMGTEADWYTNIAVGDMNGDGALDIVAGHAVYLNDGKGNFPNTSAYTRTLSGSVDAVGDVNGDGALDIVARDWYQNMVYLNDGAGSFYTGTVNCLTPPAYVRCFGTGMDDIVAVEDMNGDGALDIVASTIYEQYAVYLNDGTGNFPSTNAYVRYFGATEDTVGAAFGDVNGDGALDAVVGSYGKQSVVYLNDGTGNLYAAHSLGETWAQDVAVGDINSDGAWDIVVGNWFQQGTVYLNSLPRSARLANNPPRVALTRPYPLANANFAYTNPALRVGTIPLTYTLFDPEGDPVRAIRAEYSPDGGGRWLPAVAAAGTVTTNLVTNPTQTHIYVWDVFASGFFGSSDNVAFRIEAYPSFRPITNGVPGPYQRPYASAMTFPFRVRGTQVRVISGTAPAPNAIVYRLPAGQATGAGPIADAAGQPFHTDGQGYLLGRGQIYPGDRLVALLPISSTGTYTLYYTSAAPTPTSLNPYTVTTSGVQVLTVTSANPLILFNLDVSLEWDARQDTAYLNQLDFNLRRASEVLYDITNGQAALSDVTLYHNGEQWNNAHLRIYANNQLRPFADQGGIVTDPVTDPVTSTVVYVPGQVNMGATWNRYGDAGITLGEDWPRTLAHELGHYLLYLDDDYLGLDANGLLTPTSTCTSTIMTDAYRDDYSELRPPANWLPACANTLSNKTTGRSDWATVDTFYPALNITSNTGPSGLPLAVTQIRTVNPVTPTTALPDPRFYLTHNGARVQPGGHAQAYLFRSNWLLNLGRPVVDQALARGAQPNDRVCVYELEANRLGCKTISANDNQQLALDTVSDWQPDVRISPVNSQTVNVRVLNLPTVTVPSLQARLYDDTGFASPTLTLTYTGSVYSGTFNLSEPALEASLHLWVNEADPRREIVTDYSLGGNPGNKRSHFGNKRSHFGNKRSHFAPVVSGDGQVILYSANLNFPTGQFYAFQAASLIPSPPPWATVVGKGYWLSRSANAPTLVGPSISMGYAQNEVPSGEESFLRVYFWNETSWRALTTTLALDDNLAVAPAQGPGLYALMSTVEIPLYGPGWDSFAYPVQATRLVTLALQSISGTYSTVYWYNGSDKNDPWKVYDTSAPAWVNDLSELRFGESYWISLTQAITLHLKGAAALSANGVNSLNPPATYYGAVLSGHGFTPTSGMTVTAWINGKSCGQGRTLDVSGQVVYTINVFADGPEETTGCGAPGRRVTFKIGNRVMSPSVAWDNNRLWEVPLAAIQVYLPLIRK